MIWKQNCAKSFLDASSNSSNIEEEVTKQINKLKPFNMDPRKAISEKHFVSDKGNNCEEEINLIPQDRIGDIDSCKCRCECKPMVTFAESLS